jgi:RHS repeat-associated protein
MATALFRVRRIAVCVFLAAVLLAVAGGAAAQEASGGQELFLVVLQPRNANEQKFDVRQYGGTLKFEQGSHLAVLLSEEAAERVRGDARVRYLQRVDSGKPVSARPDAPVVAATAETFPPVVHAGTNVWTTGTYTYDGSGNISDIGPNAYRYDRIGRLASAFVDDGARLRNVRYDYDQTGNKIGTTIDNEFVGTPADAATNRLSSTLGVSYDPVGNLTRTVMTDYQYDPVGSITRAGNDVHLYTADDERIATAYDPGSGITVWRWRLRDLEDRVVREYEGIGDHEQFFYWKEDHFFAGSTLLATVREAAEGGRRHFHVDHLGTPRLVTNVSGQRISEHTYLPFGIESTSITQERARGFEREEALRFTGHERDGLEKALDEHTLYLDYMHARYYEPNWSRFLSVDPLLDIENATKHPQLWNRYAYVGNNPLRHTDPDGRNLRDFINAVGPATAATGRDLLKLGKEIVHYNQVKEAFSGFSAAPANEKAMAVAIGVLAVADIGSSVVAPEKAAIQKGASKAGSIVLGHFPGNREVAAAIGAEFLNIANWTFGKNRGWLRDALRAGKDIYLSIDPTKVRAGSVTEKELIYLAKRGWEWVKDAETGLWKAVKVRDMK